MGKGKEEKWKGGSCGRVNLKLGVLDGTGYGRTCRRSCSRLARRNEELLQEACGRWAVGERGREIVYAARERGPGRAGAINRRHEEGRGARRDGWEVGRTWSNLPGPAPWRMRRTCRDHELVIGMVVVAGGIEGLSSYTKRGSTGREAGVGRQGTAQKRGGAVRRKVCVTVYFCRVRVGYGWREEKG